MNCSAQQKDTDSFTPLMRQYAAIKQRNADTILLYRMGDFYEMFNEDAKIASRVLGLTLTSRNHGGAENTPLAGFPFHALDRYASKLVKAGYKIAICEQIEDPKLAKGVVQREVVEIISAGTATDEAFIDEKKNNFIVAISVSEKIAGIALCDLTTGEFSAEEIDPAQLEEELVRIDPSEVVVAATECKAAEFIVGRQFQKTVVSGYEPWKFSYDNAYAVLSKHFGVVSLQGLGLEGYSSGICAAGALLSYLKEQKKNDLKHITALNNRRLSEYAQLDPATIRNLELLRPIHSDDSAGTLLWVLDKTSTAMGARLLRRWITHPLKDIKTLNDRLDCVEWLKSDVFVRNETELYLKRISDIERIIGRISFERANARDCIALRDSCALFPGLIKLLCSTPCYLIKQICKNLEGFEAVVEKISSTILDSPSASLREGGLIRLGVSKELDELRDASVNGKKWIAQLQESERQRTGIASLKVGYNKVFGYYIEVSKANLASVPHDYIRKQTLVNGERFITPELKDMESKILGAEERLVALEYELFCTLRKELSKECPRIQKAAEALSVLDIFVCLAKVAAENRYSRPILNDSADIIVTDGRHPVVERMNPSEEFVPNDTNIVENQTQILLITGPNMAGKSTYLRQNALIALMAQIGSFVPASSATIGIVDKFFTRVGASDRLARGQSTFLVEMIEVANILNNATNRSLVLLDEVGRGTSTFDGISIAWAVAECLHESVDRRPRTFFATHYHELTELATLFPRIKNLHIKVKEWNDQIIFLRKIAEGSCDHSYGIQVARLAGVPRNVIMRAKEILSNLEKMELTAVKKPILAKNQKLPTVQLNLFGTTKSRMANMAQSQILKQLIELDLNTLTPLEAMNILAQLKKIAEEESGAFLS